MASGTAESLLIYKGSSRWSWDPHRVWGERVRESKYRLKRFRLGTKRNFSSVLPRRVRQWRRSPWEAALCLSLEDFSAWLVEDLSSQVCPQGCSFRISLCKTLWPSYEPLKWESELYRDISFFQVVLLYPGYLFNGNALWFLRSEKNKQCKYCKQCNTHRIPVTLDSWTCYHLMRPTSHC